MRAWLLILVAALVGLLLLLGGCDWASFSKRAANPYPGDLASAARGQALFFELCAPCHGLQGKGDGPLAATLKAPPTDFTDRSYMVTRGDPDFFWGILRGRGGIMPPFQGRLSEAEMWDLVNYVRTLYPASP
ncbi:MAG: cytochrome c [Chloroflexi bacterium]|nr:cytochrome c [Chloroflexota bacterium]